METTISLDLRAINVRSKVTIFDALEFIGVSLLHGHNTQQIICPFHDDSKPSARAYGDSNKLFCFTCHKLWDPISAVMDHRQVGFGEAATLIEQHFKIESPLDNIPLTVRYNVEKRPSSVPNLSYLADYVEQRLVVARFLLGLDRYTKLLTAIDLMAFNFRNHKVTEQEYRDVLKKVLTKIPSEETTNVQ